MILFERVCLVLKGGYDFIDFQKFSRGMLVKGGIFITESRVLHK